MIQIAVIIASFLYVVNSSLVPPPESGLVPLYDNEGGIGVLAVAYWIGTETMPWSDAHNLCLSYDMKLAQPTTTSSAEKIRRILASQNYSVSRVWMGLCGDSCGSPVTRWCWNGPPKAAMDEELDVYWVNSIRPQVYTSYCSFIYSNNYGSTHYWSSAAKSAGMLPLCEY